MKKFDFNIDDIFNGLSPKTRTKKNNVGLEGCHNLEPVEENDYDLHELVVDMNEDSYDWGNA